MTFRKVLNSILICALFSQSTVYANVGLGTIVEKEISVEAQKNVIAIGRKLFDESTFGQYLIKRSLKNQLKGQNVAIKNFNQTMSRAGAALPGVGMQLAYGAGVNALQTIIIGAITLGALSYEISNQQQALTGAKESKALENFGLFAEYLVSSGEMYTGLITGFSSGVAVNAVFNQTIRYMAQNPAGIGLTKNLVLSGAQSYAAYMGFSFGSQLWKMVVQMRLTEEEQKRAEGLLGRKMNPALKQSAEEKAADSALFWKIMRGMNEFLFENAELRDLLLFNWWRFELATSKGVVATIAGMPMMMHTIRAASLGQKIGGARGILIMIALGAAGGLIAAELPEESLRITTVAIQTMRSRFPKGSLYPNEVEIKNILKLYEETDFLQMAYGMKEKSRMADKVSPLRPSAQANGVYVKNIQKLIEKRKLIREEYVSVVYEKLYDASHALFYSTVNTMQAQQYLSDLELREALSAALAVDENGRFAYIDREKVEVKDPHCNKNYLYIFPSINRCKEKEGSYHRNVVAEGTKKTKILREFLVSEIDQLSLFYKNEIDLLQQLAEKYKDNTDLEILNSLLDERDKLKEVLDNNQNILAGLLHMDQVVGNSQDDVSRLKQAYLATCEKVVTMMRDYGYTEDLILGRSTDTGTRNQQPTAKPASRIGG